MSHKAYAFDWWTFEQDELYGILIALDTTDQRIIARYIEAHHRRIKDPYEGQPLPQDWDRLLENRDVEEYADFALTRFYDPSDDRGLGESWLAIGSVLTEQDRRALLGIFLGPSGHSFDPGRQGSYFQTPADVVKSLRCVEALLPDTPELRGFSELLRGCVANDLGVYVTF